MIRILLKKIPKYILFLDEPVCGMWDDRYTPWTTSVYLAVSETH